jgi:hypothetical protein
MLRKVRRAQKNGLLTARPRSGAKAETAPPPDPEEIPGTLPSGCIRPDMFSITPITRCPVWRATVALRSATSPPHPAKGGGDDDHLGVWKQLPERDPPRLRFPGGGVEKQHVGSPRKYVR